MWDEVMAISNSQILNGKAWMVLGDFNQILHPQEHSRVVNHNVDRSIRDFRECLRVAELEDLNYRGNIFTWWNK